MKRIFNLFAAILVVLVANAKVTNINSGTTDALRKALSEAASGDTIVMAAGTYVESNSDYIPVYGIEVTVMADKDAEVIVVPKVPIRLKTGGRGTFINIKFDCGHLSDLSGYSEIIVPSDGSAGKKLVLEGCEFYGWKQKSNSIIHTRSDRQIDTIRINNCYFHDNLYNCILLKYASVVASITNCTFADVTTDSNAPSAGVVHVDASQGNVLIDHCTFYNCQTKNSDYGVINVPKAVAPVVSNCIFAMPEEYADGRAVYNANGEVNNCLTYNYAKDENTGIHSGPTITACIQGDPKFVDAANGDLRIQGGSPALGAGTEGSDLGDPRWIPTMEYYLVGSMTDWKADPKFKLAKNPENENEYIHALTLYAGQEFKIAKSDGLSISDADWFPSGMGNNYQVTHSGEYTVYFRPDGQGGEGWHEGYIFAQAADLGPWEAWFYDVQSLPEFDSYITYNEPTGKVTVYIREKKATAWTATLRFHGIPAEDGKCYSVALKMKANHDINQVTLKWQDDNDDPYVIYEYKSINLAADEEFVYYNLVAGKTGNHGSNGILSLDFGFTDVGDIIEIYDVAINEEDCPEPPTYYLAGSMTEWAALAEYMFIENPELGGEYLLETDLEEGDAIKVVGISEGEETWFPGGIGKEYVVDANHAGHTTVFFRPAGNEEWAAFGGYFFIPDNGQGIETITNDQSPITNKFLRDGKLFIENNGRIFNTMGTEVK